MQVIVYVELLNPEFELNYLCGELCEMRKVPFDTNKMNHKWNTSFSQNDTFREREQKYC